MDNKLFVLIGPYNSGKSTLIKKLIDLGINYIPAYSTKRSEYLDRKEELLRIVSDEAFNKGEYIIKYSYKGNTLGLQKNDVLSAIKNNKINVTITDQHGAKQLQRLLTKHVITIFLMVDYVTLVDRMLRNGNNNDQMKYHLEYAETNGEFNVWKTANHVIKNTCQIEQAFNQLMAIMGLSVNAPKDVIAKLNKL